MTENTFGWVDPEFKVQNLPILKNGTNFISTNVSNWGWSEKFVDLSNNKISRFVIIRDPYERWLSGLAQDLDIYFVYKSVPLENQFNQNQFNFDSNYMLEVFKNSDPLRASDPSWFFSFLIDKGIYKIDHHTDLQFNTIKTSIEHLGLDNISFIKMTDRLGDTLNYYLGTKQIKSYFTNYKVNSSKHKKSIIYQRVIEYFSDPRNANRKERVLDYLTLDYQLYNSVKFVNDH